MFIFAIIGAILPALWLKKYFVEADRFPEPRDAINGAFWGGIKTVFWVLLIVMPVQWLLGFTGVLKDSSVFVTSAVIAFGFAAIPEEFFKFRVLKKMSDHSAFDEPMDGIVYGAVASLGFATLENVMYCIDGGMQTVILRAFTAVPAHAAFGAIMGYHFSKQHFQGKVVGLRSKSYLYPVLIHGLYNYLLFVVAGLSARQEHTSGEQMTILGCLFGVLALGGWMFFTVRSIIEEMQAEQAQLPDQ